jgi:adiponectin receptor
VLIYAFKLPESLFAPGRFDLVGASHQIWHLLVVLAAYLHFAGVNNFRHFRYENLEYCAVHHG